MSVSSYVALGVVVCMVVWTAVMLLSGPKEEEK